MAIPGSSRWQKLAVAAPALIVTTPLVGHSLLGDDRRRLYRAAQDVGSNLFRAVDHSLHNIGNFLDRGNFRPVGRAVENIERAVVFEIAEATGLPLHAVNGAFRLVLLATLAVASFALIAAILQSSGVRQVSRHPVAALYPMALAATLVAGDHYGPITSYSLILIGSIILVFATALWVARDKDMTPRRLAWHEPLAMLVCGAVLASAYDLTYLGPPFAAVFVAARAYAGSTGRALFRMACVRRWAYLSAGFFVVFVPVRIEIARRCTASSCYAATDVDLTADVAARSAERLLTGAPPAGWRYTAGLADAAGISFNLADLATNALLFVLLAAVVYITVGLALSARHSLPSALQESVGWTRTATSLSALGATAALMPALLVGLSRRTQEVRPQVGEAWRETIMVQVGWSLLATAVLVCVFGVVRTPRSARLAAAVLAVMLGIAMTFTLLANARLTQVDRVQPLHVITTEVATAVVHFDPTESGNDRRCQLIEDYIDILPNPRQWVSGPNVWSELDRLTLGLHGIPFCDPELVIGNSP